jgi:hypothetical protein
LALVLGAGVSAGALPWEPFLRLALSNALRSDASDWARCPKFEIASVITDSLSDFFSHQPTL